MSSFIENELLHKNNPVSFDDFVIVLVSNFARTSKISIS